MSRKISKANFQGFAIHSHDGNISFNPKVEFKQPDHYKSDYDVVDLLTDLPPLPFLVGDVIKRIIRLDRKGQKELDLKKITYNLRRLKECEKSMTSLEEFNDCYDDFFIQYDKHLDEFESANKLTMGQSKSISLVLFFLHKLDIDKFIKSL